MHQPDHCALHDTLYPTVVVLKAYRYASRARAIKQAWRGGTTRSKLAVVALTAAFIGFWFAAVVQWNYIGLFLSAACSTIACIIFKVGIADRYPPAQNWREFEHVFGLMYRFRRYLMFREQLMAQHINAEEIHSARSGLQQEKHLLLGRAVTNGPWTTSLLAVATSLVTTLLTRDVLLSSGWTILIFALTLFALFIASIFKMSVPTPAQRHLELESFVQWYEMELAAKVNGEAVSKNQTEESIPLPSAASLPAGVVHDPAT